jgi:hypothetical protein
MKSDTRVSTDYLRRPSRLLASTLVLGAVVWSACGPGSPSRVATALDELDAAGIPRRAADVRGVITDVRPGTDTLPTPRGSASGGPVACPPDCAPNGPRVQQVLIEEYPGQPSVGNKSVVMVLRSARLLRRTATGIESIRFTDFDAGARVEAWYDGPAAVSYPVQASAAVIIVDAR